MLTRQVWHGNDLMDEVGRARLSLDGLSVGDAFGERFFGPSDEVQQRISRRELPDAPWTYTDDTEMALSIVEILEERGGIDQDVLATRFAEKMQFTRNYGRGTHTVLCGVKEGLDWRLLTKVGFRGMGSFGNGAAMRVAPLGAFFADEPLEVVCNQARLSAEVTHAHAEGVAGAIAVAAAAALAWQRRGTSGPLGRTWIAAVRDVVPAGYTRDAVAEALDVPSDATIVAAARALGNGSGVTAPDTVPLCLWVVAHASRGFDEALWHTVAALGDRDTTCAIVGGLLALTGGPDGIPRPWLQAREALPIAPIASTSINLRPHKPPPG
jgi:ADP-ribosylglycohydrolase